MGFVAPQAKAEENAKRGTEGAFLHTPQPLPNLTHCAAPAPAEMPPLRCCAEKARADFFERARYDREHLAGHPLTFQVENPGDEPSGGARFTYRTASGVQG